MDLNQFRSQLQQVIAKNSPLDKLALEDILNAIPRIDELDGMKKPEPGRTVLIRADLDVPIENGKVEDPSRLESILKTIEFALSKQYRVVLMGHIGRDKENTLAPVCEALSGLLKKKIDFIPDWIDEGACRLQPEAADRIKAGAPGSLFMLENARKYDIERALWKIDADAFQGVSERMFRLCSDIREKMSTIEINEAIAASNLDFSSCAVPLLMDETGLGFFIDNDMKSHIRQVREANLVVFSGLKIDKLDDLQGILERGNLKEIISAGSLAMALEKAKAQLDGRDFFLGLAETDKTKKFYIDAKRIEQAKAIVKKCREQSVKLVLPVDFVLDSGEVSTGIPEGRAQMDIGPATVSLFRNVLAEYRDEAKSASRKYVLFYNGVFGKFEDPKFEKGTKEFIGMLKDLTAGGVATYVGGGEGRLALQKYGSLKDVTYAFTAGGTVLKSLSNKHIGYLKAMYLQNKR